MVRFVKYGVVAVIVVLLVAFAFANRHTVTLSFDPFTTADNAAFALTTPLFAVAIGCAMLGVVAGAFATWLSQGRHRRASRQHRADATKWRAEAEKARAADAQSRPALPRS